MNIDKYNFDGLNTIHNCEFLSDKKFKKAYERGVKAVGKDYQWYWRVHVGLWAANIAVRLDGDFVECGVNKGFLSSSIMDYLDWNKLNKKFYLLDTFCGIDLTLVSEEEKELNIEEKNQKLIDNNFYTLDIKSVIDNFSEFKNVEIIKGSIPHTLENIKSDKIAFASIDLNCSPPEVAAMEFLWEKLVPGAIVVLDDYAYKGYEPQKKGMDEFAKSKNIEILSLPTGQGIIIKSENKLQPAEILRDSALIFEENGDIETALKIMKQARILRPQGPFINKKIQEYEEYLNKINFIEFCPICGNKEFKFNNVLVPELIKDWTLNNEEVEYINLQQGFHCNSCFSNLRSMTLAKNFMEYFNSSQLLFTYFVEDFEKKVLEINEAGNLTKYLKRMKNHILLEYPEIDMQNMNINDNEFDVIIHSDTLEHIPNSIKALKECYRVLKPKGVMFFTIPIIHDKLTRKRLGLSNSYHGNYYAKAEDQIVFTEYGGNFYLELLEAGFKDIRIFSIDRKASISIIGKK